MLHLNSCSTRAQYMTNGFLQWPRFLPKLWTGWVQDSIKRKQTTVTPWDSSSPNYVSQRTSNVANLASNVIHFFIMHNITSVFLLFKLFLLLFLSFPFLVLGYLGHLQPVGHLPVETKRTAWSQHTNTHPHTDTVVLQWLVSLQRTD